jgi:hypothetical protein
MSSLAPALEAFFTSWLLNQRRASPHTIAAYRDTFRLLLGFAQAQLGKPPAQLDLADLDAALIGAFLDQLRQAGIDISVIALWLGHESTETTQVYLHADLAFKEQALARTTPPHTTPGRYRAPDTLLAFLEQL